MFTRIIVPLDGTEHAELALPVATRIARATGGSLLLLKVVLPQTIYEPYGLGPMLATYPTSDESASGEASPYLKEVLRRQASLFLGIKTETLELVGAPSPTIFQEARFYEADLIVLCSRGETGLKRWAFSSVAQQAVRHCPASILVLNEHGFFPPFQPRNRPLCVLLPLDGSPLSETVLEPTIRMLAALVGSQQTVLHLLRVVDIPFPYGRTRAFSHADKIMQEEEVQKAQDYLHGVMGRVQEMLPTGLNLTIGSVTTVDTDAAKAILSEAGTTEEGQLTPPYDLIALATHGRSGLSRLLMGSVTEKLLGATLCPLFIVRPHHKEAGWQKGQQKQKEAVL